jgi:hypothetical protein
MKIRNGFVSNSSSSSFHIRYDKRRFGVCEKCGQCEITPLDIADIEERNYDTEIEWKEENYNVVECKIRVDYYGILWKMLHQWINAGLVEVLDEEEQ